MFNKKFLLDSIILLLDQLDDLDTWSVYNDDEFNEEIKEIRETVNKLRGKVNGSA